MRELAGSVDELLEGGHDVALAIVVDITGSAPRPLGTAMAVSADGRIAGNVSAGCVEGAVVEQAQRVLAGEPPRVVRFGITDEQAISVGLTCGGTMAVLVTRVDARTEVLRRVLSSVSSGEPVALAAVVSGSRPIGALVAVTPDTITGTLHDDALDRAVAVGARRMLSAAGHGQQAYDCDGDEVEVFIHSLAPPPRMLVFGAVDLAASLTQLGAFLGYEVTVCDARPAFATRQRFPAAAAVAVEWPHHYLARTRVDASTVICVLTHDAKFDVPLLVCALQTPASYVGLLGSRRTQQDRMQRLREAGVPAAQLARIRGPLGLDLGAQTPAETAVSIGAEIVALRRGGTGVPLRDVSGSIHKERAS